MTKISQTDWGKLTKDQRRLFVERCFGAKKRLSEYRSIISSSGLKNGKSFDQEVDRYILEDMFILKPITDVEINQYMETVAKDTKIEQKDGLWSVYFNGATFEEVERLLCKWLAVVESLV